MLQQIKILAKQELCNIYGRNVSRYTKDPRVKRKSRLMLAVWVFFIALVFFYVGGLSYGLFKIGAGDVIPAYLVTISSLVIFFFATFKAGNVIFGKHGYDILCSLPVSQKAVVFSRFLRMYVENLVLALVVMLPGTTVYAWFKQPGAAFYLIGVVSTLAIPLLPVAAATFIGALIKGIASRMKHKSLVEAGLTILIVLVIPSMISKLSGMEENITPEMLKELSSTVLGILGKLYPPAIWLGMSMVDENILPCLGCIGLFIAVFVAVILIVSACFHSICRHLFSTSAKHNYRMESLQRSSVQRALCKKELRRYFASGIYVCNTIVGPVLGMVFSATIFFVGVNKINEVLSVGIDIRGLIPFILAGVFCVMTTTSTSVSMEGKNWWIVKSLPIDTKTILDAKIMMNLILMFPCYLVSEVFLILALKPQALDLIWMLVIPALIMLFACVYGITINLHFPVLDWESEVSVVKQSASAMLGGMGGLILAILCAVLTALVPDTCYHISRLTIGILILGVTAVLYRKNNRTKLQDI